jgi:hypothetical protein
VRWRLPCQRQNDCYCSLPLQSFFFFFFFFFFSVVNSDVTGYFGLGFMLDYYFVE